MQVFLFIVILLIIMCMRACEISIISPFCAEEHTLQAYAPDCDSQEVQLASICKLSTKTRDFTWLKLKKSKRPRCENRSPEALSCTFNHNPSAVHCAAASLSLFFLAGRLGRSFDCDGKETPVVCRAPLLPYRKAAATIQMLRSARALGLSLCSIVKKLC